MNLTTNEQAEWGRTNGPIQLVPVCTPSYSGAPPKAVPEFASMLQRVLASDDRSVTINVLANDYDTSSTNPVTLVDYPSKTYFGRVWKVAGGLKYQPGILSAGPDVFTYTIRNKDGLEATARVTVYVAPTTGPLIGQIGAVTNSNGTPRPA